MVPSNQDPYDLILRQEFAELAKLLPMSQYAEGERICLQALAVAVEPDALPLLKEISELPEAELRDFDSNKYCLEARCLQSVRRGADSKEIEELAAKAVSVNDEAVFAHRILGRFSEQRGDFLTALSHYSAALSRFPESDRSRLDCVKMHLALQNVEAASSLLKEVSLSLRRELYRLASVLRGNKRTPVLLLVALLLFNPISGPALSVTSLTLVTFGGYYSFSHGDGIVLVTFAYILLLTLPALLLHFVLPPLMSM